MSDMMDSDQLPDGFERIAIYDEDSHSATDIEGSPVIAFLESVTPKEASQLTETLNDMRQRPAEWFCHLSEVLDDHDTDYE